MQNRRTQLSLLVLAIGVGGLVFALTRHSDDTNQSSNSREDSRATRYRKANRRKLEQNPRSGGSGENLVLWWDGFPPDMRTAMASASADTRSNIHPDDYAGPDACRKCHADKYANWSTHPHRWMNALATDETVKGDFSGTEIQYLGGRATFLRENGELLVKLERDQRKLTYRVKQTIGSRYFQYYIGHLFRSDLLPIDHPAYTQNHVLPFGYWLDEKEWVPIVHVGGEMPDGQRNDPFDPQTKPAPGQEFFSYAEGCNTCHTTFPMGDTLVRRFQRGGISLAAHAPYRLNWNLAAYVKEHRPGLWPGESHPADLPADFIFETVEVFRQSEADKHAVTLGISCEACHYGCKEHVANPKVKPEFFPRSPHLFAESPKPQIDRGRSHTNVNWACARCHVGNRPKFAGGMSTWNSTEFSDAMQGSCYSQLTCITCHDPHLPIGKAWARPPVKDDAICLKCHQEYVEPESRQQHTRHAVGSEGDRCMSCHMPRINEGIQSVVRTHTIFSPTNRKMIEANHPNACNLCHTDKPMNWTLTHLEAWYGTKIDPAALTENYPQPEQPVAIGWLKSENEAVRLVAADALTRTKSHWALPDLLSALDDRYLLNRQFARMGIERMCGVRLSEHGYQFYMTPEERQTSLTAVKDALLKAKAAR